MCNVGISIEKFNPEVLYSIYCTTSDTFEGNYHCHDFIEFSYIVSGNVNYKIDDKFYLIKEKTLLPFNAGVYHHEYFTKGINSNLKELHVGFRNLKIDGLPLNHILKNSSTVPMQFNQYGEDFHKCCLEIIEEHECSEIGKELVLKSLVMKLIALFLKETNYVKNTKKLKQYSLPFYDKSNIVEIIIDYFEKNYMNNISLNDISKNMYISSVYISKTFKEKTGESPINYLINLRLQKAKDLLLETEMPVKIIAQSVGYSDAYYFSKLFKKYYEYSPNKYRSINSK